MAEYIEREALLEDIQAAVENEGMGSMVAGALKRYVKRAPAADVVSVVRCKDCKYFRLNDENVSYCSNPFGLDDPEPNGFCNYGREKDV